MLSESSANVTTTPVIWNAINWRQTEKSVRNLRQRIFMASKKGDLKKVKSLQKLMLRSKANALMSVRRVSQISDGKNTPGIDKLVVKSSAERTKLVHKILQYQSWRASPAKRVYIPKSNNKMRPLGIPTIADRAMQALVKNALEPFWEARFEATSYGFRPGRGCHDAIGRIYSISRPNTRKKWVVDADIKGAFDNISHDTVLNLLDGFPAKQLVKQWLKSGYLEDDVFYNAESGTPQGGVISPLLANIALHGLEQALDVCYDKKGHIKGSRALVRYADDFVIFCETEEDAVKAQAEATEWLKSRGLALSPEKTKIRHLSEGFDFLGFNVRQYPAPKTSRSGWKLLIKPSKSAVQKLCSKMKEIWLKLRGQCVNAVLKTLNPIIRGWANYYRTVVSKATFNKLDNWMFNRCVRYARHTHPSKPWKWIVNKYWGQLKAGSRNQWVFGDKKSGAYLLQFNSTPIVRHVLIRGSASPDDPMLRIYWDKRRSKQIHNLPRKWYWLAKAQKGRCSRCNGSLLNEEELHQHHVVRRKDGGDGSLENLRLIHLLCHQQEHYNQDGINVR